eukprot:gene11176-13020_t
MKYKSTRGSVNGISFIEAIQMGLAEDGGLIVPETIPQVDAETLAKWCTLSFQDLSFEILSLYIDRSDISAVDLKGIIDRSYSTFGDPRICPLHKLDQSTYILELFHGPTFSFKDVALQMLGNLFEHILERTNDTLAVVVATSGDTGSAAIHGLRGKRNIGLFVLYPEGKISPIQELQMTTVHDANVHPLAVADTTFDEAQALVKALFSDLPFKRSARLGAVNSINWARILVQTVYYFYAHFQVQKLSSDRYPPRISFSVPTGNFGDVLAGYYAKRMGLPIERLVVATNANDILDRFFRTGVYSRSSDVVATCTPSMDIKIASNFERYLYYACNEQAGELSHLMDDFNNGGSLQVTPAQLAAIQQEGMVSVSISPQETIETITRIHQAHNYLIDPHTAVGVAGARHYASPSTMVCLATAHPAKFGDTVKIATNNTIDIERSFKATVQLLAQKDGPLNRTPMQANQEKLTKFIQSHLPVASKQHQS